MFAIIETGGKQIIIKENDLIYIEKLDGEAGKKIKFNKVVVVDKTIGTPYVENVYVEGTIIKQGKQKKIVVYRHNPKSTHKKKYGHRQPYTLVKINKIKTAKG